MATTLNPIKRHRGRCTETRAMMSDYLDGELDARSTARLERHVRWCPNCRRMLTNLRRVVVGLGSLSQRPPAGEDAATSR